MEARPFFQKIKKSISRLDKDFILFSLIQKEPTDIDLNNYFQLIKNNNPDLVIGCGGGSVMDTAKVLSCLFANDIPLKDMAGSELIPSPGPMILLIPSIAGSGSEVTHEAVITDAGSGTRFAIKDAKLLANCVIIDPLLAATCSKDDAIISGIDAFIHAIESIGNLKASACSEHLALKALSHLYSGLKYRNHSIEESALIHLAAGSMLAGLAFASTGTAAVHALGYPLTSQFGVPHGLANASVLPYVLDFNRKNSNIYSVIEELFGISNIAIFCAEFVAELGLKTEIKSFGVKEEMLPDLAQISFQDRRHLSVNPTPLSVKDIENIYKAALESQIDLTK
jgi:alcohol dehydrogenase class IV